MTRPDKSNRSSFPWREFAAFVEAEPQQPTARLDERVMQRAAAELQRRQWPIFGKVLGVETSAAVATLFVCPQFDIGFAGHNQFLHALHTTLSPAPFYLLCGAFFVLFGALLSGLLLSRGELAAIRLSQYLYYPLFALAACLSFVALGAEMALLSGLSWVAGAWAANLVGLGVTGRARLLLN